MIMILTAVCIMNNRRALDSIWIENLNSVLDDNKTLTLANGDRLNMSPTSKIIFEPHNIDNASPATVSRNGMVYMSSSGLDWRPVLEAWLKTRCQREVGVFQHLFEESFATVYTWGTQNLNLTMKVLQCNIVQQMLILLQGLVAAHCPEEEEVEGEKPAVEKEKEENEPTVKEPPPDVKLTQEHLHRLYVFSLIWGMGALLELADRAKFDSFLKEKLTMLDLPKSWISNTSVFDFVVSKEGKSMVEELSIRKKSNHQSLFKSAGEYHRALYWSSPVHPPDESHATIPRHTLLPSNITNHETNPNTFDLRCNFDPRYSNRPTTHPVTNVGHHTLTEPDHMLQPIKNLSSITWGTSYMGQKLFNLLPHDMKSLQEKKLKTTLTRWLINHSTPWMNS
ncbi:hypothetical protein J6590_049813 [Homalodisca vitripennis]|nr:hypothetical protein J6590_049813 [Homalodisca vitripennis]